MFPLCFLLITSGQFRPVNLPRVPGVTRGKGVLSQQANQTNQKERLEETDFELKKKKRSFPKKKLPKNDERRYSIYKTRIGVYQKKKKVLTINCSSWKLEMWQYRKTLLAVLAYEVEEIVQHTDQKDKWMGNKRGKRWNLEDQSRMCNDQIKKKKG